MDINELSAALSESEDMRETIGRSADMFGVALLAGREKAGIVDVRLVGSGTLYEHHGSYYVLTARHVWEAELRNAKRWGSRCERAMFISFTSTPARSSPLDCLNPMLGI